MTQATDEELRSQQTKMNSFRSWASKSLRPINRRAMKDLTGFFLTMRLKYNSSVIDNIQGTDEQRDGKECGMCCVPCEWSDHLERPPSLVSFLYPD